MTFDGVTIEKYGGSTNKGTVLRRVIYAKRTTQTEYMGIHRAHSLGIDWASGDAGPPADQHDDSGRSDGAADDRVLSGVGERQGLRGGRQTGIRREALQGAAGAHVAVNVGAGRSGHGKPVRPHRRGARRDKVRPDPL